MGKEWGRKIKLVRGKVARNMTGRSGEREKQEERDLVRKYVMTLQWLGENGNDCRLGQTRSGKLPHRLTFQSWARIGNSSYPSQGCNEPIGKE